MISVDLILIFILNKAQYKTKWNMILISNDFWHKRQIYNFDAYNVLLAISTNIPVLLMTAFVLQGHMI